MSTALKQDLINVNTTAAHEIKPGRLGAVLQQVVARMIGYCEQAHGQEPFQARGLVINTLEDIQAQLDSYFPASTHIAPIMDDLAAEVALTAKKMGQPYVALTFSYVDNGVIPPLADGQDPKAIHIKFYSTDMQMGSEFSGRSSRLQPGWSSSSAQPIDMRKQLNLGAKKGFLLEVSAVDVKNIRAQALDSTLGMIAALGMGSEAMATTREALFDGSIDTPVVKDIIAEVLDIKSMQARLELQQPVLDAVSPLTPVARQTQTELATLNLTVALATKVEALVAALPALQLPAPLQATIAQAVQPIRHNIEATQLARAIEALSVSMPTRLLEAAANDHSAVGESRLSLAKAVENIKDVAAAQKISVREAISLSLQGEAPTPVLLATQAVTTLLADQTVIKHVEQALPLRTLDIVRKAIENHAVEAMVTTPIGLDTLRTSLAEVSAQTGIPSLGHALAHLDKALDIDLAALPKGLQQTTMAQRQINLIEQVADNLNAMAISNSVAPAAREEIKILAAQLKVAIEQPHYISAPDAPIQTAQQAPIIISDTSAIQKIAERVDAIATFQVQPLQPDLPQLPDATAVQKILIITEALAKSQENIATDLANHPIAQAQQSSVPDTAQQTTGQTQQSSVPDTAQQTTGQTQQSSVPDTAQQTTGQTQQSSVPDTAQQTTGQTQQTGGLDAVQQTTGYTQQSAAPDTAQQTTGQTQQTGGLDAVQQTTGQTQQSSVPDTAQQTTTGHTQQAFEQKSTSEEPHICGPDCAIHGLKREIKPAEARTADSPKLNADLGLSATAALETRNINQNKAVPESDADFCRIKHKKCSGTCPDCPMNALAAAISIAGASQMRPLAPSTAKLQ